MKLARRCKIELGDHFYFMLHKKAKRTGFILLGGQQVHVRREVNTRVNRRKNIVNHLLQSVFFASAAPISISSSNVSIPILQRYPFRSSQVFIICLFCSSHSDLLSDSETITQHFRSKVSHSKPEVQFVV